MKVFLSIVTFFLLFSVNVTASEQLRVVITSPKSGTVVEYRHEVNGTVSDPNADVWVVIRPVETSDFWVAPPVTVKEDGSWKVKAYFGEDKPEHSGKPFEVRAFANPVGNISEGKTTQWPRAAAKSNVANVVRK
jgi:hypothetical protein